MNLFIFKLKFTTPVRFGGDYFAYALTGNTMAPHSDTLFSAISNEWIKLYGEDDYQSFYQEATKDNFLLSDMLPFKFEDDGNSILYVPKPIVFLEKTNTEVQEQHLNLKKQLKDIEYIKIEELDSYMDFLKTGGKLPISQCDFGENHIVTKVAIGRTGESLPYNVVSFIFNRNAGLYFIVKLDKTYLAKFKNVVISLGETGIGGKRSSGYGKFILQEDEYEIGMENGEPLGIYQSDFELIKKMNQKNGAFLSLSLLYPKIEDISDISSQDTYTILSRRGFVYSKEYAQQFVKRKPSYAFNRGSVFKKELKGQIIDLSIAGTHPVFRYGKGFFIGGIKNE